MGTKRCSTIISSSGMNSEIMEIAAKNDAEFACNAIFDRIANPPKGRDDGAPGAAGWVGLSGGGNRTLRTKGYQVIPKGEHLLLLLPGGGGYGDPKQRDPALVAQDVRDGLISPEAALRDYGVTVTQ